MKYFFDSYAIIEIITGNANYEPYLQEEFATGPINISEVYYALLKEHDQEKADEIISKFHFILLKTTYEIALKAAEFRFNHRKSNMSYADAVGYITAKQNDLIFLTGDKEFAEFENVEFVK